MAQWLQICDKNMPIKMQTITKVFAHKVIKNNDQNNQSSWLIPIHILKLIMCMAFYLDVLKIQLEKFIVVSDQESIIKFILEINHLLAPLEIWDDEIINLLGIYSYI